VNAGLYDAIRSDEDCLLVFYQAANEMLVHFLDCPLRQTREADAVNSTVEHNFAEVDAIRSQAVEGNNVAHLDPTMSHAHPPRRLNLRRRQQMQDGTQRLDNAVWCAMRLVKSTLAGGRVQIVQMLHDHLFHEPSLVRHESLAPSREALKVPVLPLHQETAR
jgi:hypothetical protein